MRLQSHFVLNLQFTLSVILLVMALAAPWFDHSGSAWAQANSLSNPFSDSGSNSSGPEKVEAVLNIIANSSEIFGLGSIGGFILGAIIAFFRRRNRLGIFLVAMCPVTLTFSLALPGAINWLMTVAKNAHLDPFLSGIAIAAVSGVLVLTMIIGIGFLPSAIAYREKHPCRAAIFACTFISWLVPCGWPLLFFWSLWGSNDNVNEGNGNGEPARTRRYRPANVVGMSSLRR